MEMHLPHRNNVWSGATTLRPASTSEAARGGKLEEKDPGE